MKYLLVAIVVISLTLVLTPSIAYAWPEPKQNPRCCLATGGDSGWQTGYYQGGRWPSYVSGRLTVREYEVTVPPQLNSVQANRWFVASPAARPKLAEMYGVPREVAEQYGANYVVIRQLWED